MTHSNEYVIHVFLNYSSYIPFQYMYFLCFTKCYKLIFVTRIHKNQILEQIKYSWVMQQKIKSAKTLKVQDKWNLLVENIVRPPRKIYNPQQLGSTTFQIGLKVFNREEHEVPYKDKTTKLTIYKQKSEVKAKIIIVFLHSNASNKLEGNQLLESLSPKIELACFDFFGCGLNVMEKNVTLGIREAQQTASIVDYLKKMRYHVVLWGRSMGAVTALLYGKTDIIIADSPFLTFKEVCKQVTNKVTPCLLKPFVTCLFPCIFNKLREDIQKQASYDVDQLNSISAVKKMSPKTQLILIIGNQDQIIKISDIQKIYHEFIGNQKQLHVIQGKHNEKRPKAFLQKIMKQIEQKFSKQRIKFEDIDVDFEISSKNKEATLDNLNTQMTII